MCFSSIFGFAVYVLNNITMPFTGQKWHVFYLKVMLFCFKTGAFSMAKPLFLHVLCVHIVNNS